ncbi:Gfo/Idh/MocA family oxidoreductase [Streptomyces griseoflavus]|uniref:Gfo/Idh/MocA family oxidoreductase n=1 Tax=Streptomyces griseoflavus TaxID=35619 RepID=UPI0033D9D545
MRWPGARHSRARPPVILTGVHEDLIEEALDAGVHVVTEKPVYLDVVRTRKLVTRA